MTFKFLCYIFLSNSVCLCLFFHLVIFLFACQPVSFSLPACLPQATVVNLISACFFFSACLPASCYSRQLYVCLFLFSVCLPASCYKSAILCLPVSFSLPACLPYVTVVNFMSACFFFSACLPVCLILQ